MKLPKLGMPKDTFLPLSAVFAFVAMIAVLVIVKRTTGKTFIGYSARRKAMQSIRGKGFGRRVPSRALIGTGQWHRRWDQMSGSSRYSKGMLHGRKMGHHISLA